MALRIGEDAEGDSRHVLRRLDDLAAELLRACKCLLDVLDTHEEKDRVAAALQRTDCGRQRSLDACVDERVAGNAPSEYVHPKRSAKNARVASGSAARISAWITGWAMVVSSLVVPFVVGRRTGVAGIDRREGWYRPEAAACGR